ncbi:hypothetical protein Kpol_1051p1 [Vanderwaltozyma polyspora DSM 70294]|uniref:Glycerophosphocholine acyltransferase 1 n=1 Tax=Vanderwaltozyma polyspora (strain ATCC 22028 / DSM 70294 / BCRC 21397 / CBS 2163 / NBRC 10782 / NRRL Y-8283 / UCD 57-17) TaxID=436907 RepID=A7TMW5_VANPO|nr:uncharacterized protein Kpol_1051p1 [Vanderwaltozyma polyspora DSM 70294]EDO16353.1 hypothetical protein Kpol_1051p1 [Vanderwaltozyma polyspora DSM 70294]
MNGNNSDDELSIKSAFFNEGSVPSFLELLDSTSINQLANRYFASKILKERADLDDWKQKSKNSFKTIDLILQKAFFKETTKIEKIFYPFTLINIFFIGFIMGKFPEWFHVYYTCLLLLLMPIRFYTYYKTNNHYYLADLCYFVNALCLVYIWIWPNSVNLYQSCFAFAFGSLSFAVITWRNSFVIHSIDKITSCFIHMMPPCTFYIIHHGLTRELQQERFPAVIKSLKHDSEHWDFKYNILWTSFYYLIWQSLYHYFITLKKSAKIKSGLRTTSFTYLTSHNFKNVWLAKLPAPYPMIAYTLLQYCYQLTTMSLCGIWFHYKFLAASFLCFIFLCASYNGAKYYIDYYGKKFEKELKAVKMQVENLQQENAQLNSKLNNEYKINGSDNSSELSE